MYKLINRQAVTMGALMLTFFIASVAVTDTAQAFRSVTQENFTDPDYINYHPKTVAILIQAGNIDSRKAAEKYLTTELEKRGIKVYLHRKLFTPTREWDDAKRAEIYMKYSIEAGIVAAAGTSSAQIIDMGRHTSFYGNSANTTTMRGARSQAAYSAVLVDLVKTRIAWTTDIYIKSAGTLFVGGKRDAKAAAKSIIKGLIENEHIPAKKS